MKLTGQADFFIKQYGADKGIEKLKKLGYTYLTYDLYEVSEDSGFASWTKDQLEAHFMPIREAIEKYGMKMIYLTLSRGIYNDRVPSAFENRKKWCLQAVRTAACIGAEFVGIQPVFFYKYHEKPYELSKELSTEAFQMTKAEADRCQIQLAFINNPKPGVYGSDGKDLLELANRYQAKILLDPSAAFRAGERVEDIIRCVEKHLLAFFVNDVDRARGVPFFPMMGALNYRKIIESLNNLSDSVCLTAMYTSVYKRYQDFDKEEAFVDAMATFLYRMLLMLDGREAYEDEAWNTTGI